MTAFKAKLEREIELLKTKVEAGSISVEERFAEVDRITKEYTYELAAYNDRKKENEEAKALREGREPKGTPFNPPDSALLDRLTDLILHEDLTDSTPWKTRQSEYPFLSEFQLARRKDGVHQAKKEGGQREVSLSKARSVGTDGRDRRKPYRRERSDNEQNHVENATLARNKARQKKYDDFVAVQPVHTYHISELEGYNGD